jgi:predicted nucleotidyltransferase
MRTAAHPDREILDRLVREVVRAVHPLQIILFGSAARNQMHDDSDLDILVVMPNGTHCRRTAQQLYRELADLGVAKDIVVVTEDDVADYSDAPSLVLCPAVHEGRELYVAAG